MILESCAAIKPKHVYCEIMLHKVIIFRNITGQIHSKDTKLILYAIYFYKTNPQCNLCEV